MTSDDQEKNQQRGRELTFRRAPGRCASERTQLIQAVRLNIFFWVLVLAAVGVGLWSIARYFRGGEDKSGGGSTQTGGGVEATQSEAEQAGASPPAGTGGAAK